MQTPTLARRRFYGVPQSRADIVMAFLFIAQCIVFVHFSFTRIVALSDYDSGVPLMQAMEIWKQKRLIPQNWSFQTTLGLDAPTPLVALLYGVSGNILFAGSLANIVSAALFCFTVYSICKAVDTPVWSCYFLMFLLLVPLATGPLAYMQMMFAGGGFYAWKALAPMLALKILVSLDRGRTLRSQSGWVAGLCLLLGLSALSTGVYLMLACLGPMAAYAVFVYLNPTRPKDQRRRVYLLLGICTVVSAAVLVATRLWVLPALSFYQHSDHMKLIEAGRLQAQIGALFSGFFMLTGGLSYLGGALMSGFGLAMLLKFVLTCVMFLAAALAAWRMVRNRLFEALPLFALLVFLVNGLMLVLTSNAYSAYVEDRYLLAPLFPLLLLLGLLPARMKPGRAKNLLVAGLMVGVVGASVQGYNAFYQEYGVGDAGTAQELQQVVGKLEEHQIPLAYYLSDQQDADLPSVMTRARAIRLYAPNLPIVVAALDGTEVYSFKWGSTTAYDDRASHPDRFAVIAEGNQMDRLPSYVSDGFTLLDSVGRYHIYVSGPEERLDLRFGPPQPSMERSVDYPHSPGYGYTEGLAELGEDGRMHVLGKEGIACYSIGADENVEGIFDYTLFYQPVEMLVAGSSFIVSVDGEEVGRVLLDDGAASVTVPGVVVRWGEKPSLAVYAAEGDVFTVDRFEMDRR